MSNSWFRFKQFTVQQDACAMKVTTDACIQGAWTPAPDKATAALDIGTGTGLLSLMLAQRYPHLHIDAVDTDVAAAAQATANAAASPWANRINVLHADIRTYASTAKYDLIIGNPPFFKSSLLSGNKEKDVARHDVSLKQEELLQAVTTLLSPEGSFSLLLPFTEYRQWQPLFAEYGLHEQQILYVKHHPDANVKRVVSILSKIATSAIVENTLTIKESGGNYTAFFKDLLGNFYLDL